MPKFQKVQEQSIEQKPKAKYRVRNWAKYNESLKQRGSITLWIDEDVIRAWQPDPEAPKKRGGQQVYTDGAIECLLTVKAVFHLAYRQTEGFAGSISALLGNIADFRLHHFEPRGQRAKGMLTRQRERLHSSGFG